MNKRSSPDTKVKQQHTLVEFNAAYASTVSREWVELSICVIGSRTNDDQAKLHKILHRPTPRELDEWLNVYVSEEVGLFDYDGVHVKHFIRPSGGDWTGDTVPASFGKIKAFVLTRRLAAGLDSAGGR